ncbi:MAG: hypothetical protein HY261_10190, partial [Chloroflexi bacterium]|nr:hypothetical protein [Chloroflexota bacterium]
GLKDCARSNINEKVLTNATVFHQIKNLPSPVTMGVPDFVVAGTDQATIIGFRRTSKLIDVSVPVLASALGGNLPPGGFKDSIPDTALMAAGYMAPEYLDQPTYKIVSTSTDPFSGAVEFKVEIPYYEEVYANCGDNLVPLHSAISLPGVQPLLVAGVKHGGMTEATVVQQLIDKLLGGVKPVGIDPKTITCSSHMSGEAAIPGQPASPPAVNNGVTITAEQSPANLHVFDAQGRHTGLATDGSIELGIPGSFFEDRGRTQEAHLPPTSQQLRVTLEGLLDTRMNVRIISGDGKTEKHVDYLAVPETKTSKAEIKFTPSALDNSTTISVDTKGDGKSVQTLKPSSVTTVTGSGATTTQGQSTAPPLGNPTTPTAKPSGSKGGGCGAGSGAELGLVFTGLIALGVAKRPRRKREG